MKAHKLHLQLKKAGHEPRFRRAMCENRGAPPDTAEFYNHVHALEDLLKFLADEHANDDPVDRTLNAEFAFCIQTGGYAGKKSYPIKRIRSGWEFQRQGETYAGNREGAPCLAQILEADGVDYPQGLGGWLEWLWMQAQVQGLAPDAMQTALDDLAKWLSKVNDGEPKTGIWAEISGETKSVHDGARACLDGIGFTLRVFSRRWGHEDTYRLSLAKDGWLIEAMETSKRVSDSHGHPILFRLMEHDSIEYPTRLGDKLHQLWEKASAGTLSGEQVQQALDALAEWITRTETHAPRHTIWGGYK